jgi:hypothetical protein
MNKKIAEKNFRVQASIGSIHNQKTQHILNNAKT